MTVSQLTVDRRQHVVYHHRRPDAETPKPEMENSRVVGAGEFLFIGVDDHLQKPDQIIKYRAVAQIQPPPHSNLPLNDCIFPSVG